MAGTIPSIVTLLEPLRYASATLPRASYVSVPVPILQKGKLRVAALLGRGEIVEPQQGLQLWPPSHVAYVDCRSGRLELLRAVTPGDFGRTDDPLKPLGASRPPVERQAPEFMNAMALFLQSCDAALPYFADPPGRRSPAAADAARELAALFSQVAEAPLLPYYEALSPAFFEWLADARRRG
jgi:hypothetical protein